MLTSASQIASASSVSSRVVLSVSSPSERRNLFAFTSDIALFIVATYFIPATTVLVGLASQLTNDKTLIGVVGMTWSVTWFLPQLVAARVVRGKVPQKPYLVIPSLIGRNAFLIIALWLLITRASDPLLTIWILIGSIALFNLFDALAGVAWFDILSRSLSPRLRSRVISVGQFIGGVLGLGAGAIVERILSPSGLPFPQNYALIFVCTWVCMAISLVAILFIKESVLKPNEQAQAQQESFLNNLRSSLRSDSVFRRALAVRVLTGIELMAASFYLVFATDQLGLSSSAVGVFNVALILGGTVGVLALGWLAERHTSLAVLRVSAIAQLMAPAIALVFTILRSLLGAISAEAVYVAFFIIFLMRGVIEHSFMLGILGYVMDHAAERNRATYVGLINTVSGVVALSPLLGGIIIDSMSASQQPLPGYAAVFSLVVSSAAVGCWLSLKLPRHSPVIVRSSRELIHEETLPEARAAQP